MRGRRTKPGSCGELELQLDVNSAKGNREIGQDTRPQSQASTRRFRDSLLVFMNNLFCHILLMRKHLGVNLTCCRDRCGGRGKLGRVSRDL